VFRKYPYWGWLIAGVVLWSIAIVRYHNHSRQIAPVGMAKTIEEDIQTKEKLFNQLLKDVDLVERIFKDSLTDNDVEKLSKQPYYLYAYKNGTLSYWNTNKILADCIENKPTFKEQLLFNEKGVFITRCFWIKNKARHLTALFPVMFQYPFENKYLANEFAAGSYIPANTRIHSTAVKGGYSVKNTEGETLFYVKFNPNSLPEWIPDLPMLALLIAALLTTIAYHAGGLIYWAL
jgi:hypothetical protein